MAAKKRLLIIHPAPAPYRIDLFNALAKRFVLKVVFLDKKIWYQKDTIGTWFKDIKFDFEYLDSGISLINRRLALGLGKKIDAFRPDAVVTSEFGFATSFLVGRGGGHRHIVWTADNPEVIRAESPLRRGWKRLLLPRIASLILYSKETEDFYRRKLGFKGAAGICPNVQSEKNILRKVGAAAGNAGRCLIKYGLVGRKVVLYMGRLSPEKRVDRLISAFSRISKDAPYQLVLVGSGSERQALETMARRLGISDQVLFMGHLEGPEFYAWFRLGCVLVLPSDFEPWGAVVNEALVGGIPAVVAEAVGAKVLIRPGRNGTVFNPAKEGDLERAIEYWLASGRPLGKAGIMKERPPKMGSAFDAAVEGFAGAIESHAG
ncbi:MAG TPA: glycosyltransferase [bacterium]|jgi:glycosyltransferase involved in cell wall biosynthesis|nr:glycosyltransferase [bacterium]